MAKLSPAEKAKRAARNERRGRNAERQSDEKRVAPSAIAFGRRSQPESKSTERAKRTAIAHAAKWKDAPQCDCPRCVDKRKRERAEAKKGGATGRRGRR